MAVQRHYHFLVNHWACFQCRKSFKRSERRYYVYEGNRLLETGTDPLTLPCPECGGPQHCMGRHFKAPKQSDKEQWKKVELLISAGFKFDFGPCESTCELPQRLKEVTPFLEDLWKRSVRQTVNPRKTLRTHKRQEKHKKRREELRAKLKAKRKLVEEKRMWEYQDSVMNALQVEAVN